MGQPNSPQESPQMAVQFSVYPLRQASVAGRGGGDRGGEGERCRGQGRRICTLIHGSEEQVFAALRAAFRAARSEGDTILIATLSTGLPSDQRVAEIQRGSDS